MFYRYYIGSNNKTKKLESRKAIKLVSQFYQGFTIYKAKGFWKGKSEDTLIIEIEARDRKAIISLAKKLGRELKQEAIGLARIGKLNFITS